jgi:hypothetical protein
MTAIPVGAWTVEAVSCTDPAFDDIASDAPASSDESRIASTAVPAKASSFDFVVPADANSAKDLSHTWSEQQHEVSSSTASSNLASKHSPSLLAAVWHASPGSVASTSSTVSQSSGSSGTFGLSDQSSSATVSASLAPAASASVRSLPSSTSASNASGSLLVTTHSQSHSIPLSHGHSQPLPQPSALSSPLPPRRPLRRTPRSVRAPQQPQQPQQPPNPIIASAAATANSAETANTAASATAQAVVNAAGANLVAHSDENASSASQSKSSASSLSSSSVASNSASDYFTIASGHRDSSNLSIAQSAALNSTTTVHKVTESAGAISSSDSAVAPLGASRRVYVADASTSTSSAAVPIELASPSSSLSTSSSWQSSQASLSSSSRQQQHASSSSASFAFDASSVRRSRIESSSRVSNEAENMSLHALGASGLYSHATAAIRAQADLQDKVCISIGFYVRALNSFAFVSTLTRTLSK